MGETALQDDEGKSVVCAWWESNTPSIASLVVQPYVTALAAQCDREMLASMKRD